MKETEMKGQQAEETTQVVEKENKEKKFLGLTKKTWKRIGIVAGTVAAVAGVTYGVKKYNASKASKCETAEAQPQVEEKNETPRENNNNRFGGENSRRERWNNNKN